MELIARSIEYINKCLSHKRSRSETSTDDLINLKRKKIDFNEFRDEEMTHDDDNRAICKQNNAPKTENRTKFEFSDPRMIFRALISKNDEKSKEILTSKLKIMKETIEIVEMLLEKQKNTKNEPNQNASLIDNCEASSDVEVIEIDPHLEAQQENDEYKFCQNNEILSQESFKEVENILNDERHDEIWGKIKDSTLLYKDIKCLQSGMVINDEIVNVYLKLLQIPQNTHIFNSFFFEYISEMLFTGNWNIVKLTRILKKQGIENIFSKKYLIFPVNLNKTHWVVAQINNRAKCIEYYDSYGESSFERVCETINEFIRKFGGEENDVYEYKSMKVPQQSTGCDCGIFMMQTIRCLVENREFDFGQEKIDFIRKTTVLELKNQTLYRFP